MDTNDDNENMNELLKALDNDGNASLMNLTNSKIKKMNNDILQKLQLPSKMLKEFHKKVKNYRYVSEMEDIQFGNYIRWISLKNPDNIKMTNGGFIIDIKVVESTGIHIVCKNNFNRIFQIRLEENIVFQKINPQEAVILQVLDYLDK